jgi:uncharacterized membrane protein YqiK
MKKTVVELNQPQKNKFDATILELIEKSISKNGLEKTKAINAEMITYLENSIPEKIFDYDGKMEMVFFVKEYLSKK